VSQTLWHIHIQAEYCPRKEDEYPTYAHVRVCHPLPISRRQIVSNQILSGVTHLSGFQDRRCTINSIYGLIKVFRNNRLAVLLDPLVILLIRYSQSHPYT